MARESANVVVDCGAFYFRHGLASNVDPHVTKSEVAFPKDRFAFPGGPIIAFPGGPVIGPACQHVHRRDYRFRLPSEYGSVTNWEAMEVVWSYAIEDARADRSTTHLCVTSTPSWSKRDYNAGAERAFENLGVAELTLVLDSHAAGLAVGAPGIAESGACLVVDVGYQMTRLCCFRDGALIGKSRGHDVGGAWVEEALNRALAKRYRLPECELRKHRGRLPSSFLRAAPTPRGGVDAAEPVEFWVSSDVARDICAVEAAHTSSPPEGFGRTVAFPGGDTISLRGDELFMSPEVLFDPSLGGREAVGLAWLVARALQITPRAIQNDVARNIVLCGGGGSFRGLAPRLAAELEAMRGVFYPWTSPPRAFLPVDLAAARCTYVRSLGLLHVGFFYLPLHFTRIMLTI